MRTVEIRHDLLLSRRAIPCLPGPRAGWAGGSRAANIQYARPLVVLLGACLFARAKQPSPARRCRYGRAARTNHDTARPLVATILAGAVTLAIVSCSDDDDSPSSASPSAAEAVPVGGDLYAVPRRSPDVAHGTLLRYQRSEPSVHPDSTTWRMMYASEPHAGEPIVVTGLAVIPTVDAPPDG